MVTVRFFGMARLNFGKRELTLDVSDMNELVGKLSDETGIDTKSVKQYLIFVNEVNIDNLKRFRTRLSDGDEILFLSPSSGG